MSILEYFIAVLLICLAVIVVLWKKSRGPNPEEKDKEDETEESSERIVYMKDHVPIWKKKVK